MYKKNTSIYTVCTTNYLEQAIIALDSAKRNNIFKYFFIFIVDIKEESFEKLEKLIQEKQPWIKLFGSHQLTKNYQKIMSIAYKVYSKLEICSLSKFIAIKYLLELKLDTQYLVYIDSDLYFFSSLENCFKELGKKTFLLTPHFLNPYNPLKEVEFLNSGFINIGFFIINIYGKNLNIILNALIDRISKLGFLAPNLGLYCEQKWISLMANVFWDDFHISKNPGCNIAYWNLENRFITKKNSNYFINNRKLIFFHFSGFSNNLTNKISIHSNYLIKKDSYLDEIVKIYKNEFKNKNKYKYENNIKLYKIRKKSLSKRINLMEKELKIKLFREDFNYGIFSKIGIKLDKIFNKFKKIIN